MIWGLGLLVLLYVAFVYGVPRPESLTPQAWSLTGLFLCTVVGSIIQPVPGGALVLLAITLTPLLAGMKLSDALMGYADTTVWLVQAAFFICLLYTSRCV